MLNVTLIIIIITCIVSFAAFQKESLIDALIFYPPAINNQKQWYRFITCGFIHADFMHLAFNMYALWMFGGAVENAFTRIFGNMGEAYYILLYISSLVACLMPTYSKNIDNYYYRSLGASGAVSAIVFTFIFIEPSKNLGLILLPMIEAPAFLFAIVYLGVSAYLSKKGTSSINHSAHLWGAIYGIIFLIVTSYFFSSFRAVSWFIQQVTSYLHSL
ncbi:MAG: rhomboid family intramembrane serine protease [Flavobacterium sp.]|nr:rhomboid family intramembrane serine protease [Flavobacterium sp.]